MNRILCLVTAVALVAGPALAADFTIRKVTLQGSELHLYHDHVEGAASASVHITVGGKPCAPVPAKSLIPGRGGDKLAVLLVLDRGGTPTTGMGQYSVAVKGAVGRFTAELLGRKTGDKVAIVDSAGRGETPRQLKPTDNHTEIQAFLDALPAPAGSGADVYGTTNLGLALLDGDTRLRAVIVISDGVDPADPKGESPSQQTVIDEAKARGIPVTTVTVDRAGELGRAKDAQLRGQQGRASMLKLANQTNGAFRLVAADNLLESTLRATLKELAGLYAQVERTTCSLCGTLGGADGMLVDMALRKNALEIAHSKSEPVVQLKVSSTDFGACGAGASAAGVGDAKGQPAGSGAVCDPTRPCPLCESCTSGSCTAKVCKGEADCDAACTCDAGTCRKRKQLRDYAPWALAAMASLGLLFVGLARRRKNQQQQAAASAEAQRQEAERLAAQASSQAAMQAQLDDERRRREGLEAQASQQAAAQAAAVEALRAEQDRKLQDAAARANPVLFRLVSAANSEVPLRHDLRAGTYLIGAQPPADIVVSGGSVSSRHAQLTVDRSGRATLVDLGSSNGTWLNRAPLPANSPTELRVGDEIAISKRVLLNLVGGDTANTLAGDAGPSGPSRGRTQLEE